MVTRTPGHLVPPLGSVPRAATRMRLDNLADLACSESYATVSEASAPSARAASSSLTAGEDDAVKALISASCMAHAMAERAAAGRNDAYYAPTMAGYAHPAYSIPSYGVAHAGNSAIPSPSPTPPPRLTASYPSPSLVSDDEWSAPPRAAVSASGGARPGYGLLGKRASSSGRMAAGGVLQRGSVGVGGVWDDGATDTAGRKNSAKRARYDDEFKAQVVREAMLCPEGARIKPTCARYPGVEPCQVRPGPSSRIQAPPHLAFAPAHSHHLPSPAAHLPPRRATPSLHPSPAMLTRPRPAPRRSFASGSRSLRRSSLSVAKYLLPLPPVVDRAADGGKRGARA